MNMNKLWKKKIKAVVFDLDDTLYDSFQYWFGAFRDISEYLKKEYGLKQERSFKLLASLYKEKTNSYPYLFDDLVYKLNLNKKYSSKRVVKELVALFHQHEAKLKPYKDAIPVLERLKNSFKIGLITNGRYSTQIKKIKALGLESYFEAIICPSKSKRKPNIKPYIKMAELLRVKLPEMIYVGDNPQVDFVGLKPYRVKTVRLLRGCFKNKSFSKKFEADYAIKNLKEISFLLKRLN